MGGRRSRKQTQLPESGFQIFYMFEHMVTENQIKSTRVLMR
jgi:hypothetical protein